jgi:hypothetical protein
MEERGRQAAPWVVGVAAQRFEETQPGGLMIKTYYHIGYKSSMLNIKSTKRSIDQVNEMMRVPVIALCSGSLTVLLGLTLFNIYYGPFAEFALLGYGPDYRGLRFVQAHAGVIRSAARAKTIPPIMIAAGIAVQSQWAGFPVDLFEVVEPYMSSGNANYSQGIAQMSEREIQSYVPGGDPLDSVDATQAMAMRIQQAVKACKGCSPTDQFIIASQAQNGTGATGAYYILKNYRDDNGLIDWEAYFAEQPLPGEGLKSFWLAIRAGEGRPWPQFQLQLFTNNLQGLARSGWQLPRGVNLHYMRCIASGAGRCKRQLINTSYLVRAF